MMMMMIIALMMEAASTSETSVNFYRTTRHYNPEDSHLHTRRRENLKSNFTLADPSVVLSVAGYALHSRANEHQEIILSFMFYFLILCIFLVLLL
jgi:hypothetical protein